jgi:hypothetical protein
VRRATATTGGGSRSRFAGSTSSPDFTDCNLTTPEADLDWSSIIHRGGPARAFNQLMPAFGDELSDEEIARLITHLRGFCTERGWPHGDLNMPRAIITEKAFPENEADLHERGNESIRQILRIDGFLVF